jgi:Mrp family chromosome partitioning ATPase
MINAVPEEDRPHEPILAAIGAHRRWAVVIVVLCMTAAAIYALALRNGSYGAQSEVLVTPLQQQNDAFLGLGLIRDVSADPTRAVETAASVLDTPSAAAKTARAMGRGWTTAKVQSATAVKPVGGTNLVAVTADADKASAAERLANTFAQIAVSEHQSAVEGRVRRRLVRLSSEIADRGNVTNPAAQITWEQQASLRALLRADDPNFSVIKEATLPSSPAGLAAAPTIVAAGLLGAVLAVAFALILEMANKRIRSRDELERLTGMPVIAQVPRLGPALEVAVRSGNEPAAIREIFATLFAGIRAGPGAQHRTLLVTSGDEGDGKTTSTIALARSIVRTGRSVVILDADSRKPDIAAMLRAENVPSLNEDGGFGRDRDVDVYRASVPESDRLSVISVSRPGGGERHVEMVARQIPQLIAALGATADYVLVDSAPLGLVGDALFFVPAADEVLLVARMGHTRRQYLSTAKALLDRAGTQPLGLIAMDADGAFGGYGYGKSRRKRPWRRR